MSFESEKNWSRSTSGQSYSGALGLLGMWRKKRGREPFA